MVAEMTKEQEYSPGYGREDVAASFGIGHRVVPVSEEEKEQIEKEMAGFSFDGYQVVRREFFSHKYEPTITIKGNSVIFNNSCISKLDKVVYVQFLINPTEKNLVIRPCSEGTKGAIRWCVVKEGDKRKSRDISCGMFVAKLCDLMGWEPKSYRYKIQGSIVETNGETLYLFDLDEPERVLPRKKDGSLNKNVPIFPENWRDSFGLPFSEHEAALKINLDDGYMQENLDEAGDLDGMDGLSGMAQ